MDSTSTSFQGEDQRSWNHQSSPDPTIKALKAGEELLDTLDHAFAEFENERLEMSLWDNKSISVSDCMKKDEEQNIIVKEEEHCEISCWKGRVPNGLASCDFSFGSSGPGPDPGPDPDPSSQSTAENSEVSDESNTEKVLELELEKRVSEWIQKVESGQEQETLSNGQSSTNSHEGEKVLQEEVEMEGTSDIPSLTPCKQSVAVQGTLPVTSIKTRILEQFVSPLAVVDGDFDQGFMCYEKKQSFTEKESNVQKVPTLDLKDELELEQDDQWDQDNNQWDFDDVDSLPSEHGDDNSNVVASSNDNDNSNVVTHSNDNVPNEDHVEDDSVPPVQELKSQLNLAIQTNVGDDGHIKISSKDENESPSPNDVVASLPFFSSQNTNHQEDCSENDGEMGMNLEELQDLLQKEKDIVSELKYELNDEKSNRVQVEQELLTIKEKYSKVKETYEADRNEFQDEYKSMKLKLEAAEHDAQEAIALAEEAANGRSEMEGYLQRALDELESLKKIVKDLGQEKNGNTQQQQQQQLPIIQEDGMTTADTRSHNLSQTSVRFSPRRKAGISAGRHLLRQAVENNDDVSFSSTQDGSVCSNLTDNTYYMMLCRRSAEKRQRLLDRLRNSKDDNHSTNDVITVPMDDGLDSRRVNQLNKMLKTVELVIRKSGKSLGLGGRWFCPKPRRAWKQDEQDEDVETMTKSYCNAVEALIANQKNELNELRVFCQYLEDKMSET